MRLYTSSAIEHKKKKTCESWTEVVMELLEDEEVKKEVLEVSKEGCQTNRVVKRTKRRCFPKTNVETKSAQTQLDESKECWLQPPYSQHAVLDEDSAGKKLPKVPRE